LEDAVPELGMKSRSRVTIIILATALAGCVNTSEPISVGRDTYLISMGSRGGFSGTNSELMSQAVKKAGAFCQSSGKELTLRNTSSSGIPGFTAQSGEVIFACFLKNDPRYNEPQFSPAPTIIVEHH
jgi:hypothetical protein